MPVSAVIRVSTGWRLRMMMGGLLPNNVGLHVVILTLDIVIILVIIVIVEIILIALIIIIKVLPGLLPMPAIGCCRCRWRPRMRCWRCLTPIVTTPIYRAWTGSIVVIGLGTGLAIG